MPLGDTRIYGVFSFRETFDAYNSKFLFSTCSVSTKRSTCVAVVPKIKTFSDVLTFFA